MFKLIGLSVVVLVFVANLQLISAAWNYDEPEIVDGINALHKRIFNPNKGEELSLEETMDLLQQSDNLFEDEINDDQVGDKQNDLGWLKTLAAGPNNCNPEWIGMIELSESTMPKSAHLKDIINELTSKQLTLCLEATANEVQAASTDSAAIKGALGDIEALVEAVKRRANGHSLVGDLADVKVPVAQGFVDFLEHRINQSLDKFPGMPISDHLKLVAETSSEHLEPSCRALAQRFGDQYGFFRRIMATNDNIQAEPELIGWYEGLNLCKKIFRARAQNLFLIAKYNPNELANKLKMATSQSEQADINDTYRLVSFARETILNERPQDIRSVVVDQSSANSIRVGA